MQLQSIRSRAGACVTSYADLPMVPGAVLQPQIPNYTHLGQSRNEFQCTSHAGTQPEHAVSSQ